MNYLCLHNNPQWPDGVTSGFQSDGRVYGVEYETLTGLDSSIFNDDVPCAVCHVDGRGDDLMIPGQRTCPQNWTKEYEGLLVTSHYNQKKSTFVCLDREPEPYVDGNEIACVVCTY